jgi:hypothetical protein
MLHGKLDGYQKRIAELEQVLLGFKKDQERIEQGIISALNRLNHFEDAVGGPADDERTVGNDTALGDGPAGDGGTAFGSDAAGNHDAACGAGMGDCDTAFDAGTTGSSDPSCDGDAPLGADTVNDTAIEERVTHSKDDLSDADAANDTALDIETAATAHNAPLLDTDTAAGSGAAFSAGISGNNDPLIDGVDTVTNGDSLLGTGTAANNAPAFGVGLAANCDRVIGGESVHSASAMVRPAPLVSQPVSAPSSFSTDHSAVAAMDQSGTAFKMPEIVDDIADDDMADLDSDEFLDLLRNDKPAFDRTAAFHGDTVMPPHETLEKSADGPELDIF